MTGQRCRNGGFQHVLRGGPTRGGYATVEDLPDAGRRAVGHSGGFPGIGADFLVYLDAGYTMAVLSNYGGGAPPVSQKIQNFVGRKG